MADIVDLTISELAAAYRTGSVGPLEATQAYLDRIALVDPDLHAFVTVNADGAMQLAAEAERRINADEALDILDGVPLSVKDAFHIAGMPTSFGSTIFEGQVAKADSGVVQRLRKVGTVFLGKTNTAEFGQSATSENMLGPDTVNPWDATRTPGGSSGGAAASVAARLCSGAVGSDGGGSIRIPAAFCGTFGLKPSSGICPDENGLRAMSEFVAPGPLTNTVDDSRHILGALAHRLYERRPSRHLRVAYCARPEGRPVHSDILVALQHAAHLLVESGHEVIETDLPLGGWNEIFGPLVLEEEHRERGHLLINNPGALTPYERSSLRAASSLDPATVTRAREALPHYRRRIAGLFDRYDLLLTPVTAVPAFRLGERPTEIDGTAVDALWGAFPFAVPFNVAGLPSASIPIGISSGMPVSAQLTAPRYGERMLLNISQDLEEAVGFDRKSGGPLRRHATVAAP